MSRRVLVTGGSGFIGTNLVEACLARGDQVVNFDVSPPRNPAHRPWWRRVDLLDWVAVAEQVAQAAPTHVAHLAARTDLGGSTAGDYEANTEGTASLLEALAHQDQLVRVVIASSMLVCRNGYVPGSDTDYCPNTAYGRSKQQMELAVRAWPGPWVLVRPASIWGPWFAEPYRDFFEAVRRRRYVHPGSRRVVKALGYVGNTVAQIQALLDDDAGVMAGATAYLCDNPGHTVAEWATEVARAWGVPEPRTVPVAGLRAGALVGDLLQRSRLVTSPPLTTFRLENMLTGSSFDTRELDELVGGAPFTMRQGVAATVAWMRRESGGGL